MSTLADILVQGVLLGGLYTISALGLSLVFGVMRLVNLSHGDLMIAAVYLALAFSFGSPEVNAVLLILVAVAFAPIGYALQRLLLNQVLDPDPLRPLLVTFGLSIVLQNLFLLSFSADTQRLRIDALTEAVVSSGAVSFGALDALILVTAIGLAFGLQTIFFHTKLGRRLRAASDDSSTLGLMGLNWRHVFGLASAIAFVVIAIAGLLLALRSNVDPFSGPSRLLVAFEAVIIGGLGSFWGTLLGAMLIGIAQVVAGTIDPGWQSLGGHLVFLVILALRPQGLMPRVAQ
ncbi:MAG: branched-chain amino acid ABC transporter permease [Roseibium sp.]|nr:branched-chain amino acid ABC transporter permease [Roseibium sp.]